MIVDDNKFIIGSANINDRSMLGDRDSEIGILVEDQHKIESTMGGIPYEVSKTAHDFRVQLFMEHFGCTKVEVKDPIDKLFLRKMKEQGAVNTQFYRDVFRAEPDNTQTTYASILRDRAEYEAFTPQERLQKYKEGVGKLKGNYVEYPELFLDKESLELVSTNIARLVPAKNFV